MQQDKFAFPIHLSLNKSDSVEWVQVYYVILLRAVVLIDFIGLANDLDGVVKVAAGSLYNLWKLGLN